MNLPDYCKSLVHFSSDIWRIIGELIGLQSIHRLLLTGNSSLSICLQRVRFTHLLCDYLPNTICQIKNPSQLRQKLIIFEKIHSESLELRCPSMTPTLLYLAGMAVVERSKRSFINYSLNSSQIKSLPWIKNWRETISVVLVTNGSDADISKGHFASLKELALNICPTLPDLVKRTHSSDISWSHYLFDLPAHRFSFPTPKLLRGLDKLESLHIMSSVLYGDWHFDFTAVPSLSSFRLTFVNSSFSSCRSSVTISGGSNLTTLGVFNAEQVPTDLIGFRLDTSAVPNIRHLELSRSLWYQYWRIQKPQLERTLEVLCLDGCVLGDDAWNLDFPPHLRYLSLNNCFISFEPHYNYEYLLMIPDHLQEHLENRIYTLNPSRLPQGLRSLIITETEENETFNPNLLDIESWNAMDDYTNPPPKRLDWTVISRNTTHIKLDPIRFCFNDATLQGTILMCNITRLRK